MQEKLKKLEGSPGCFVCDNNGSNPRALALELFWDEGLKSTLKINPG